MGRIAALRALEQAVEAGAISTDLIMEAFPEMWESVHVLAAFDGHLDAAKALHEAVLPGWNWMNYSSRSKQGATIWHEPDECTATFHASAETAARAWLLAIIRALIAKEATNAAR